MSEGRIGRIVAVALHEAIAARLPLRLEFYEHWLVPPRLLSGSVGLASFFAVLSFLRQEGDVYGTIVREAGGHAADWFFDDVPVWTRARWRWLPQALRLRVALGLARRLAGESSPTTRGRVKWRRREGRLEVEGSAFCSVRSRTASPLCGFYAAALERFCRHLAIEARVAHETCRAMGAEECVITVSRDLPEQAAAPTPREPRSAA